MTKRVRAGLAYLTSLIAVIPTIAAAWSFSNLSQGPRDLIEIIKQFLAPFFEVILGANAFEEFFFAKVLLLILLFVIIAFVLNRAKVFGTLQDHPGVIYVIAGVVSILAMRFMPESELIRGILLPYSALGIAITTFLPLIIYFFFVHNSNFGHFGRRAGWALYGIIFLALWNSREVQLSQTSNWIYWSAIGFVILSFIFDSSIHGYFKLSDYHGFKRKTNLESIAALKMEIKELKQYGDEEDPHIKELLKQKEKQLEKLISKS